MRHCREPIIQENCSSRVTTMAKEWSSTYRWIPITGGFFAFALAFIAGANDVPASFGVPVGSGALSLSQSVALAVLMEVTGATVMGNRTVDTFQSSILRETPNPSLLMWGFMMSIIAATIWLAIATYLEIPVSSSFCIKGAVIGISITTQGMHSIYWKKHDSSSALRVGGVLSLVLSWIIAPLIAAMVAFILFSITRLTLLRSEEALQRVLRVLPAYYGLTIMALVFFVIYWGSPRANIHDMEFGKASLIAGLSGILAATLAFLVAVPLARKQFGLLESRVSKNPQNDPTVPPASESQLENIEMTSMQQELNADEILRQFQELRVLETVHEVDEEEEEDPTPPALAKCSSFLAPPRLPLKQLLACGSSKMSFSRLEQQQSRLEQQRSPSIQQKLLRLLYRLRSLTIGHKIQYNQKALVRHALAETFDANAEKLFGFLQILIASVFSFSHGSNEITTLLSPYAATIQIYRTQQFPRGDANVWILAIGSFGVSIGFSVFGWKLIRCFGGHITYLTPSRGLSAQISAIVTVVIASKARLPLSTEHILVGAILGVGAADNIKNVNWKLIVAFILMWVATLISTCGIASALFAFTIYSPSYSVE